MRTAYRLVFEEALAKTACAVGLKATMASHYPKLGETSQSTSVKGHPPVGFSEIDMINYYNAVPYPTAIANKSR